jgi:signal peptidase I
MNDNNETTKPVNAENPPVNRKEKIIKEAKSITLIIIAVLAFRSVLFEPFKIPSGSMIPTLLIGDFILVNKFSYGFKVPFSDWFSDPIYIFGKEQPKRGDVIVFKYPKDTSLNYIKRVIGLPGDTIEVIDKIVYINNEPLNSEVMKNEDSNPIMEDMDEKFKQYNFKFFNATTGEHKHTVQIDEDNFYNANYARITVPENHFFVMGDNRDFSADSRAWGFVPFTHVKGKAILIWFSFSFPFPWSGEDETFKFRPWRIGKLIN